MIAHFSTHRLSRPRYALPSGIFLVGLLTAASARVVNGQASTQSPLSATQPSQPVSRTIRGQVVNALNGLAIPRALVNVSSRQALTDSQGKFEFPQFADAYATVTATKPGYSQSRDAGGAAVPRRIPDLDAPVQIMLYPDALITGTVAASDGLPLSRLQITLSGAAYDNSGLRWNNAGSAMTNSRGEYRFSVPPGRYRVSLQYNPHTEETGEAVLPLVYPENSSSAGLAYMEVEPGQERHVDLSPRMGQTYSVSVQADRPEARQNIRFSAVDQADATISLGSSLGSQPGEYRVELPSGSYILHAESNTRDELLVGSTHVTVAGKPVSGLILHLAPVASLPVDIAADPASSPDSNQAHTLPQSAVQSVQAINPQQWGLSLHNLAANSDGRGQDVWLSLRPDKTYEFRAPPGRYRLVGQASSWYVESATYGGITDLLTSEIVIAPGSAGAPIHIVANNQRGTLHGQVAAPASSWVYLFPRQPTLAWPSLMTTGNDGSFYTAVPVGSYSVVAFEHRLQEDLRNPEVLDRLTAGAKTVEVTSGGNTTVNLELSPLPKEPQH